MLDDEAERTYVDVASGQPRAERVGAAFGYLVLANELSLMIAPIAGLVGTRQMAANERREYERGLRALLHTLRDRAHGGAVTIGPTTHGGQGLMLLRNIAFQSSRSVDHDTKY